MRAKTLAKRDKLLVSRERHRLMIDMLRGRNNWTFAQLCVDHIEPSKSDYLARAAFSRAETKPSSKQSLAYQA